MRSELLGIFLDEAEEQLRQLEQDILRLEQSGASDEAIQSIFRTAHTLKGSSAVMGFEQMKLLAHEMENVLERIRRQELAVTPGLVNVLFECHDMLCALKSEIERNGTIHTGTDDMADKLRSLAAGAVPARADADGEAPGPEPGAPPAEPAASAAEPSVRHIECRVTLATDCEMKAARTLVVHQTLSQHMRVLATEPPMEEIMLRGDVDEAVFLVETDLLPGEVEALIRRDPDVGDVVLRLADAMPRAAGPAPGDAAERPFPGKKPADSPEPEAGRKETESHPKSGQTIRVDVERLDHLMNLVGELVIDQTRIAQASGILRDEYRIEALEDLEQITNHITRVISELQESVMKTRMLPIERLFSRFPRMVRDLAQDLGKDIELIVVGKETELDRTVIEEIGDPLIHLIRNAVDHGIETREERLAAGKPAKGTIRLSAMNQENHVIITVEDDGRGISPGRIRASAVAKGLLSAAAAEAMSDRDAIQLIFTPGFSTAAAVSEVSGRGVGMDIVRAHIEKLQGLIDIDTKPGEGTKLTIKLPLTLAIVRGLLIRLSHLTYALPMSSVVEIVRIPQEEIRSVKGRPVVRIREQIMPIAWLHDYFRIPRKRRAGRNVFVVVIGVAEKRLGLVVDELIGNQEIVVKPIGSYVGKVDGVSGATILGDGSVALILDAAGVMKLVSAAIDQDNPFTAEQAPAADGEGEGGAWISESNNW